MVTLSAIHYIFILMTIIILICLVFKKEIVHCRHPFNRIRLYGERDLFHSNPQ